MLTRLTKPFLLTLTLVLLSSSLSIHAPPVAAADGPYHPGIGAIEVHIEQTEKYICRGDYCGEDYTRILYEHTDIYPGGTQYKEEEDYRTEQEWDIADPQICGFRRSMVVYEGIQWADYMTYKVNLDYPDAAQEWGYYDGELSRGLSKGTAQFVDILRMRYEVPEGGCVDGKQQTVTKYDYTITSKPAPDSDGDGIADAFDACPDKPGEIYGNGCPVKRAGDFYINYSLWDSSCPFIKTNAHPCIDAGTSVTGGVRFKNIDGQIQPPDSLAPDEQTGLTVYGGQLVEPVGNPIIICPGAGKKLRCTIKGTLKFAPAYAEEYNFKTGSELDAEASKINNELGAKLTSSGDGRLLTWAITVDLETWPVKYNKCDSGIRYKIITRASILPITELTPCLGMPGVYKGDFQEEYYSPTLD